MIIRAWLFAAFAELHRSFGSGIDRVRAHFSDEVISGPPTLPTPGGRASTTTACATLAHAQASTGRPPRRCGQPLDTHLTPMQADTHHLTGEAGRQMVGRVTAAPQRPSPPPRPHPIIGTNTPDIQI